MLQSLAQLGVAFLQFLEQPHVLDGDDGLGRKGFQQSDLFIGEWVDFDSTNENHTDRTALAKQRRS